MVLFEKLYYVAKMPEGSAPGMLIVEGYPKAWTAHYVVSRDGPTRFLFWKARGFLNEVMAGIPGLVSFEYNKIAVFDTVENADCFEVLCRTCSM